MARGFLKFNQVKEIYCRYQKQDDASEIAADYKISVCTVRCIGEGRQHSDITGHRKVVSRKRYKLPDNIAQLYETNSLGTLALEFECSRCLVRSELIRRGVTIRPVSRADRSTKRPYNRKGQINYGNQSKEVTQNAST